VIILSLEGKVCVCVCVCVPLSKNAFLTFHSPFTTTPLPNTHIHTHRFPDAVTVDGTNATYIAAYTCSHDAVHLPTLLRVSNTHTHTHTTHTYTYMKEFLHTFTTHTYTHTNTHTKVGPEELRQHLSSHEPAKNQ